MIPIQPSTCAKHTRQEDEQDHNMPSPPIKRARVVMAIRTDDGRRGDTPATIITANAMNMNHVTITARRALERLGVHALAAVGTANCHTQTDMPGVVRIELDAWMRFRVSGI